MELKTFIIYPILALLTPIPVISSTTEEVTVCNKEAAKGPIEKETNKASRNLPSYFFFISSFIVSVTPSINTPEPSNNFMILITSFISSFKKK